MSDVAELKDETGPITILRTDKQRAIIIGANPGGQDLNGSSSVSRRISTRQAFPNR